MSPLRFFPSVLISALCISVASSLDVALAPRQTDQPQTSVLTVCKPAATSTNGTITPCANLTSLTTSLSDSNLTPSTNQSFDLSYSVIDYHFDLLEDLTKLDLTCKNCTTNGTATLTESWPSTSSTMDNLYYFLEDGFLLLQVQDLTAHIELSTEIATKWSKEVPLSPTNGIPVYGFDIEKLAKAGLFVQMYLVLNIEVDTGIDLTYGFDVELNPNSYINLTLNGNDTMTATAYGFLPSEGASITPIPININDTSLSISLSAQLRTQVNLTMEFDFDDAALAEISAYVDTPALNVEITPLSNVTTDCTPSLSSANDTIADILGDVVHIVTELEFDVGVAAAAHVHILDFPNPPSYNKVLKSITTPLPTLCEKLIIESDLPTLMRADKYVASVTSASAASAASAASVASVSSARAAASSSARANGGEIGRFKSAGSRVLVPAERVSGLGVSLFGLAVAVAIGCVVL